MKQKNLAVTLVVSPHEINSRKWHNPQFIKLKHLLQLCKALHEFEDMCYFLSAPTFPDQPLSEIVSFSDTDTQYFLFQAHNEPVKTL